MLACATPQARPRTTGVGQDIAYAPAATVAGGTREATRRGPLVDSVPVPGLSAPTEVKIASERVELEEAFQLLAENYRARGYEPPGPKTFRFTPYHVLPDTVTFVAKRGGRVVATLSLVPDTALLGLPMESIYAEEIARLRLERRRIAEVTSLASDTDLSSRDFIRIFRALIRLMKQYHVSQGGDTWVITVNPRHRSFYTKTLGFAALGPRRSYDAVGGHPAEAYLLDLGLMRSNAPEMYREVFGERLPGPVLAASGWSPGMVRHLGGASTQVDRGTLEDLLRCVEDLGSAPRWMEDEAWFDRLQHRSRKAA